MAVVESSPCKVCNGTGKIIDQDQKRVTCPHCKGTGEIEIHVPVKEC
jgi:DnaJ-class molecular chaperone